MEREARPFYGASGLERLLSQSEVGVGGCHMRGGTTELPLGRGRLRLDSAGAIAMMQPIRPGGGPSPLMCWCVVGEQSSQPSTIGMDLTYLLVILLSRAFRALCLHPVRFGSKLSVPHCIGDKGTRYRPSRSDEAGVAENERMYGDNTKDCCIALETPSIQPSAGESQVKIIGM